MLWTGMDMSGRDYTTVNIPLDVAHQIDAVLATHGYSSRSEFVRDAVRRLLRQPLGAFNIIVQYCVSKPFKNLFLRHLVFLFRVIFTMLLIKFCAAILFLRQIPVEHRLHFPQQLPSSFESIVIIEHPLSLLLDLSEYSLFETILQIANGKGANSINVWRNLA